MEKVYVIPMKEVKKSPKNKRAMKAVKFIKKFIEKHMKGEKIKIDGALNEKIWERGIKHIPPRIKVKASKKDDGSVFVALAE